MAVPLGEQGNGNTECVPSNPYQPEGAAGKPRCDQEHVEPSPPSRMISGIQDGVENRPDVRKNAMKIVRLLILDKEDVKERLAQLGADVSDGLTADELANLYSEWLEQMPADVDLVGVYVGGNQMNIVANNDAVWELPAKVDPS